MDASIYVGLFVQFAGWLAALLGLVLAVWAYYARGRARDLSQDVRSFFIEEVDFNRRPRLLLVILSMFFALMIAGACAVGALYEDRAYLGWKPTIFVAVALLISVFPFFWLWIAMGGVPSFRHAMARFVERNAATDEKALRWIELSANVAGFGGLVYEFGLKIIAFLYGGAC